MVYKNKITSKLNIIKSQIEQEYYEDVLNFCNHLYLRYNDYIALSLLSLKITFIEFTVTVFETYNFIVNKYGLNVNTINTQLLLNKSLDDDNLKIELAMTMTNNLLKKINYKIFKGKNCLFIKKL